MKLTTTLLLSLFYVAMAGKFDFYERGLKAPKSTKAPTIPSTKAPTIKSTKAPTIKSTKAPTIKSTKAPSIKSTKAPTVNIFEPETKAPKSTKAPK